MEPFAHIHTLHGEPCETPDIYLMAYAFFSCTFLQLASCGPCAGRSYCCYTLFWRGQRLPRPSPRQQLKRLAKSGVSSKRLAASLSRRRQHWRCRRGERPSTGPAASEEANELGSLGSSGLQPHVQGQSAGTSASASARDRCVF